MLAFAEIADVLGLPAKEAAARSPFGLMSRIEDGLPFGALDRVARLLAPSDAQFKYRLIPKATYERRKSAHRLSSDEGARLARVARVWSLALDVWQSQAWDDWRTAVTPVWNSEIRPHMVHAAGSPGVYQRIFPA